MIALLRKLTLAALVAAGVAAPAQALCPDAGTFSRGKFISDICWVCMFPMQIGPVTPGPFFPDDVARTCICPSATLMGIPTPGIVYGMWRPTQLMETVRQPGCFPSLGTGTKLSAVLGLLQGETEEDFDEVSYHSTHIYTFPTGAIVDMLTSSVCSTTASYDIDIAFLSEIDPTHSNPMLSMVVNPEAALFTNSVARAVCIADAAASTVYKPLLHVFWCMGAWGQTYALGGYNATRTPIGDSSLQGAKALAIMHKRGMADLEYGPSAVCRNHPFPVYPKQQYRYQVMHPIPQPEFAEWTGRATLPLREWRNIPVVGEDYVQLIFSYQNCCIHLP